MKFHNYKLKEIKILNNKEFLILNYEISKFNRNYLKNFDIKCN